MKLLTIADGFGDSVAVPPWYPGFIKWPRIIGLMTNGLEVTDLCRYGAGNEYMLQCLRQNINHDLVLIQWAMPNRLDLVLAHPLNFWQQQIAEDKVYNNNVLTVGPDQYWISSASAAPGVQEYHKKFISLRQHQLRSQMFVEHAKLLLLQQGIDYRFLLTPDSEYLKESVTDTSKWCWHQPFKGMCSFRSVSKFADLDFGLTQPISLVQFDFIRQHIMPELDLPWRSNNEISAVENMLHRKYKEAVALKNT
jgi:hypothetical protein